MSGVFAMHLRHAIVVDRPVEAVFDVATTTRHWPDWHPATVRVSGQIDAPARLGDQIVEHVRIAGHEGSGTWTVIVCEPPHRLVLDAPDTGIGHVRISYTLTPHERGTRFVRELSLPPLPTPINAAMDAQSRAGLDALAALLEREIPA
ncbi:MAG: SRPBCC family protein [Pseudonocardia sp.]